MDAVQADQFSFVAVLEANAHHFRREVLALPAAGFRKMPSVENYHGDWSIFPLLLGPWEREYSDVDLEVNRALCPETMRVLGGIEGVFVAGFMRLAPGASISEHTDPREDRSVRCHVGLVLPPAERERWPEGTARLMDTRVPHRAANDSAEPRITLLIDVMMPFVIPTGGAPDRCRGAT